MINTVDLTFEFEFGLIDSRYMQVELEYNQQIVTATPDLNKVIVKDVKLPSQLTIRFSGKKLGKDTIIDSNGNILKDMYVKLAKISVDQLKIPEWSIQKNFSYTTEQGNVLYTSYVGFNGTMVIDIPESTVFSFYRRLTTDFS